ncbi:MAG TPA: plastocyanin/azurin family copper-binding protein [Gemmatimonadales bacterium]|nr:plastocyanin/azurin family copper-binding protein [Gemmatimonadales bacterium]
MTGSSRRSFFRVGGLALVGLGLAPRRAAAELLLAGARPRLPAALEVLEVIEMRSDIAGGKVWFDPIGLYVEPGTTIRWITRENVHTTTAYHPRNGRHPLRIPDRAAPWDSGFLVNPGDHFDVTLTEPGVYDYYCMPHEAAGMVGRIVVGKAAVTAARPFDYWVGKPGTDGWLHVPEAARTAFPSVARILAARRVHVARRKD